MWEKLMIVKNKINLLLQMVNTNVIELLKNTWSGPLYQILAQHSRPLLQQSMSLLSVFKKKTNKQTNIKQEHTLTLTHQKAQVELKIYKKYQSKH